MMSQYILDASALLAVVNDEKGCEQVKQAMALGAAISTVNVAEVVSKLSDGSGSIENDRFQQKSGQMLASWLTLSAIFEPLPDF